MSSLYDPAEMARHDEQAARRFPGGDFRRVLAQVHEVLRPKTYVEIGVMHGDSLRLAQPETRVIGIDPAPQFEDPRLYRMTSRDFFGRYDLLELLGEPVAFAFIDGCHLFEEVLTDLLDLERYATSNTLIAIHDTIPLDPKTASRQRTTEFYTGDVWKVIPFLNACRPDLRVITLGVAPSGLTLIRGLDAQAKTSLERVAEFAALEFGAFLQNTPVQSISTIGSSIPFWDL